jgi:hypothetical protein
MKKVLVGLAMAATPGLGFACATCARDQSSSVALLVGGMILAPYLVAAVVIRAVRAAERTP